MSYTPYYAPRGWEDQPDQSTPVTGAALNAIEAGIQAAAQTADAAAAKGANLSDLADVIAARTNLVVPRLVTAEQHGADPTGNTDTSAALQAALDAAAGAVCYIGEGTYNIGTATLNVPQNTRLVGAGRGATILSCTGTNAPIQMANGATAEKKLNVYISDMTINAASAQTGINCKGMTHGRIERVEVFGVPTTTAPTAGTVGILLDGSYGGTIGCWWNAIRDCYISGWDAGVKLTGVNGNGQANENQIEDCRIAWTNRGVWVNVGDHNTIRNNDLTSSATGSVGVYANDRGTRVLGNRYESTAIAVEVGPLAQQVEISEANGFNSQTAGAIGVQLDAGSKDTRIGTNDFSASLTSPIVDHTANDSTGATCTFFDRALLVPIQFAKASLAAGFSGNINLLGSTASNTALLGRGYQIRGCTARLSAAVTAGTCEVQPGVSGTPSTTLTPTIVSGSNHAVDWQAMGKDANTAGTTGVVCKVTTSADFAPSGSAELVVIVWVEFLPNQQ